jgi:hypothetical protein
MPYLAMVYAVPVSDTHLGFRFSGGDSTRMCGVCFDLRRYGSAIWSKRRAQTASA